MRTVSNCALCLLKLAATAADAMAAPEPMRLRAVKAALEALSAADFRRIPPAIAGDVLERVYAALETADPFAAVKAEHDRKALALAQAFAPSYLAAARGPANRLDRAVRLALAGNMIDLATLPGEADPAGFEKWLAVPWAIHDGEAFAAGLERTADVLYLCDNAGEVAFDRVLAQEILDRGKRVTVAVKGGPALNDATLTDARAVGLDKLGGPGGPLALITTGGATMGVDLGRASAEFLAAFRSAGMVIAKGQANLESLHDAGRDIFFLTLVKCAHVSRHYGVDKGRALLYQGGRESGMA